MVRDVGLAEDLAQDALVAALEQWPKTGVPDKPGAWLMTIAKRRAIDRIRRSKLLERKQEELAARPRGRAGRSSSRLGHAARDDIGDDLLRLMFISCHPVLSTEARVALTLRLLGGLTTDEIARAFLVPEPTVAQRIVRAKRTLPKPRSLRGAARRRAGGAPLLGARGRLPRLQRGLLRHRRRRLDAPRPLRRRAAPRPHPGRARSRGARGPRPRRADGDPGVPLPRPRRPRRRAGPAARPGPRSLGPAPDPPRPGRPRSAPSSSAAPSGPTRCRPRSPPATPAPARRRRPTGRASPRSTAPSAQLAPSPVVELNRAVAVGDGLGPRCRAGDRRCADRQSPSLREYHLLPSVRGDLLQEARPLDEARAEFERAASLTRNARERTLLLARAEECARS